MYLSKFTELHAVKVNIVAYKLKNKINVFLTISSLACYIIISVDTQQRDKYTIIPLMEIVHYKTSVTAKFLLKKLLIPSTSPPYAESLLLPFYITGINKLTISVFNTTQ